MAEHNDAPRLDLSTPPKRATVVLPDGSPREIRSPEEFTTPEFKALVNQMRALGSSDDDEILEALDELTARIFVDPPDMSILTLGDKHRIVNFFSRLGVDVSQTTTSSASPGSNGSSADG